MQNNQSNWNVHLLESNNIDSEILSKKSQHNISTKKPIWDQIGNSVYSWDDSLMIQNCYTSVINCPIYGFCKTFSFKRVFEDEYERNQKRYNIYRKRRCLTLNSRGRVYQPDVKTLFFYPDIN
jgi:hypothetical protein